MKLDAINQLLKSLDREVWIVTAAHNGREAGLLATFVSPVSIVPELPRLLIALSKLHYTRDVAVASGALAVHLLTQDQFDLAWHFGTQSGHAVDKFQNVTWTSGETGSPVLDEAQGWLECRIEQTFDVGDRTLFLAEVVAGDLKQAFAPLTQRQLIERSSADQLQVLRTQMAEDAARDAAAIREFRAAKH